MTSLVDYTVLTDSPPRVPFLRVLPDSKDCLSRFFGGGFTTLSKTHVIQKIWLPFNPSVDLKVRSSANQSEKKCPPSARQSFKNRMFPMYLTRLSPVSLLCSCSSLKKTSDKDTRVSNCFIKNRMPHMALSASTVLSIHQCFFHCSVSSITSITTVLGPVRIRWLTVR